MDRTVPRNLVRRQPDSRYAGVPVERAAAYVTSLRLSDETDAVLLAETRVEEAVLGGTVLSMTVLPASSRRNSLNSIATSLIV
jgi:hypothetical protein